VGKGGLKPGNREDTLERGRLVPITSGCIYSTIGPAKPRWFGIVCTIIPPHQMIPDAGSRCEEAGPSRERMGEGGAMYCGSENSDTMRWKLMCQPRGVFS
jgi:hypothetical protein